MDGGKRSGFLAGRAFRETRPEEPALLDTVGWVYFKMGDVSKAVGFLEKAAEKNPENALVNYHTGLANFKSGKVIEAKEHLRKAVESKEEFDGKEEAKKILEKIT